MKTPQQAIYLHIKELGPMFRKTYCHILTIKDLLEDLLGIGQHLLVGEESAHGGAGVGGRAGHGLDEALRVADTHIPPHDAVRHAEGRVVVRSSPLHVEESRLARALRIVVVVIVVGPLSAAVTILVIHVTSIVVVVGQIQLLAVDGIDGHGAAPVVVVVVVFAAGVQAVRGHGAH